MEQIRTHATHKKHNAEDAMHLVVRGPCLCWSWRRCGGIRGLEMIVDVDALGADSRIGIGCGVTGMIVYPLKFARLELIVFPRGIRFVAHEVRSMGRVPRG